VQNTRGVRGSKKRDGSVEVGSDDHKLAPPQLTRQLMEETSTISDKSSIMVFPCLM
jgi:hypothetical protein